ncbi:hypothetical protein V2J09_007428 [Rumex salicifolius]
MSSYYKLLKNTFLTSLLILSTFYPEKSSAENSNLFREYIGAEFKDVKFSDLPIDPKAQFDFILSFAIDYTTSSNPTPTNGQFNIFWDSANLSPAQVTSIKSQYPNVRVALSLGGDSVGNSSAYFQPTSVESWVSNAVSSLTKIIKEYNLDGIDIDYEHFKADNSTFSDCIGTLIMRLKQDGVIKFASIAPFDSSDVQDQYLALWREYGSYIDYVNFQFYAYDSSTTVDQFISYYQTQKTNYKGGKILTSFISDGSKGLAPQGEFFDACQRLKDMGELYGIFVWSADDSKALGFKYEKKSQVILVAS